MENIFFNVKENVVYQRQDSDLNGRFQKYLKKRFGFVEEGEGKLKERFREIDETQEHNTFFELFLEKLCEDLEFNIVKFEDFTCNDNTQQTQELFEDMKIIVENNMTNIETNTKAIQNLKIIKDVYQESKLEQQSIMKSLTFTEEKFNMETTPKLLEEDFNRIDSYIQRVGKAIMKVRMTQLSFTMEDTDLQDLIDSLEEDVHDNIEINWIEDLDKQAQIELENYYNKVNKVKTSDLEGGEMELTMEIKKTSNEFVKYFRDKETSLVKYLTYCYVYRDKVFDELLDDFSLFVSDLLRKITAYKTYIFIKFYKGELEGELSENLKFVMGDIKDAMDNNN